MHSAVEGCNGIQWLTPISVNFSSFCKKEHGQYIEETQCLYYMNNLTLFGIVNSDIFTATCIMEALELRKAQRMTWIPQEKRNMQQHAMQSLLCNESGGIFKKMLTLPFWLYFFKLWLLHFSLKKLCNCGPIYCECRVWIPPSHDSILNMIKSACSKLVWSNNFPGQDYIDSLWN